jgi:hypothetical protein
MKHLTIGQQTQISSLTKSPLIDFASISFYSSGFTHVQVSSTLDVNWHSVAMELSEIFPNITIDRRQVDDGEVTYHVEVEEGIHVFLMMNVTPVEKEWTCEEILRNEG